MIKSHQENREDFEAFYNRNYKMVYKICYTYMKTASEAEDCTQDTFVKVLTGKYIFNDENHEKAWLTVTSINICKNKLKSWWKSKTVSLDDITEEGKTDNIVVDDTLAVVKKLPTKYKDVIYLYYYMEYSTDEIAKMLKKPSSTIRNHLMEARKILRERLGGDLYE